MNGQKSENLLTTMDEICEFTGLTEKTVLKMWREVGFPARKLEGTWYSHKKAIDDWMYDNCYPPKKRLKK